MAEQHVRRRLAVVLAADVVGYSRLMGQDEAGTMTMLKARRKEILEPTVAQHHGRIFKITGDGVLVEFDSAVNAVQCAVELQHGMAVANGDVPETRHIVLRIGVNVGDVMVEGNDLYGDGVNIAARLEALAEPGSVLISGTTFDYVKNKIKARFRDLGTQTLKNIAEPVRVFCVDDVPSVTLTAVNAAPGRPSIAVLPFANISGDPEQEYFSDGISEDIITDLSKVSGLFVVARNSVFTFKGKPVKVQHVSRELGVSYILEGSVRRAGSRVRITAQLVNGTDGGHVWADRYDRDLTDIFAIQDDITRTIVEQLKVTLLPQEKKTIGQAPTGNVEAYTYYLRGRQFLHRHSRSYYQLARRMFMKAIELDPLYARAYAGVADCDSFLFLHYNVQVPIERILAMSAKALELDGDLAEAHASRGLALSLVNCFPESDAEFKKALTLAPNSFEAAYLCARASFTRGDMELAARCFERAADIKPDDYQSPLLLLSVYRALGREHDLMDVARTGVKRAQEELARHPEDPRPAYLGAFGLMVLGDTDGAKEWATHALTIDPDDVLTQYNVACFNVMLGENEKAISMLEGLAPFANSGLIEWIKHDSDIEPIRSHPRFLKLLEAVEVANVVSESDRFRGEPPDRQAPDK